MKPYAKNLVVGILAIVFLLSSGCVSNMTFESPKAQVATQLTQALQVYTRVSKLVEINHDLGVLNDEQYVRVRDLIDGDLEDPNINGVYEDLQNAKIDLFDGNIEAAKAKVDSANLILNTIDNLVGNIIKEE